MTLSPGARLGPYEIVGPLGSGGMGEVYTARDTRLDRTVAVKVLPAAWAESPEMKRRFEREAQLIASLNHPHICKLHDVHQETAPGADVFLVMEHLEGETLAARLSRGPLPVNEAIRLGIAIANALDAAHRQGVVHRDLKPGNIMLTANGPKLLDFGLAKLYAGSEDPQAGSGDAGSEDPALHQVAKRNPTPITKAGVMLGTVQYMAPEQLDGLEADPRTDIFALGVVLHEAITGRRAFEGKSQVLLISAIATADPPPVSTVQPAVPRALDHVIQTCLAKDPEDRWQTARDVMTELRWIAEGGSAVESRVPAHTQQTKLGGGLVALLVAAGAIIVALGVLTFLYVRGPAPAERLEARVLVSPLTYGGNPTQRGFFAISPDGRQFVMRANPPGEIAAALYLGTMDFLNPQRLAGTEEASQPFWSPDGQSIAFVANDRLLRISVAGGTPQPICEAAGAAGGTWNHAGIIVFGSARGLFSVRAEGGTPTALTTVAETEAGHFWPRFLPDGRRFLYLVWSVQPAERAIVAGSLDSKERTQILQAESPAVFAPPGFLVFRRERGLYAQQIDEGSLTVSGEPMRLADDVPFSRVHGFSGFDGSRDGTLMVYRDLTTAAAGTQTGDTREWQLAWVTRDGQNPMQIGTPGVYRGAELGPDGQRVAVHRHDGAGGDIWVVAPSGTYTKITFNPAHDNSSPVWSHDGLRITYASLRNGKWGIHQAASDGTGREETLIESELPKAPLAWSHDGGYLLYRVNDPRTRGDLWVLPTTGDKTPKQIVASEADERHGQLSPDGKWIAYASSLTGRREIYVQPFPSGPGRWQVSPDANAGGDWPRWSRETPELFYHSLGSGGPTGATTPSGNVAFVGPVFSARWKAIGGTFTPEPPREVVRIYAMDIAHTTDYHTFSVSARADRFLIFQFIAPASATVADTGPDPAAGLTLLMNWQRGMKR